MLSDEEKDDDLKYDIGRQESTEINSASNTRKRNHSENVSENHVHPSSSDVTDDETNDTLHGNPKRQRLTSTTLLSEQMLQKIRKPNYEVIEGMFQKQIRKRLVLFPNEDRQYCYEYYWSKSGNRFFCCGCVALNEKRVRAHIQNINTENEYVKLDYNNHICSAREYANLKIREKAENILRPPDYVIQNFIQHGIERKTLFLFDPQNRELGYQYSLQKTTGNFICGICYKKGQYVVAKYHRDEENGDYIELGEKDHVCDLRPYKSVDDQQDVIVNASNFAIYPNTNESKLFVFNSKEKNNGYEFSSIVKNKTSFKCLGCQAARKPVVTFNLCKNDDDELYLRMAPNQNHACKIRKYTPGKFNEIYIYRPNFVFYTKDKSKTVNLIIFNSDDKKQCYDFQFGGTNIFHCKACRKKKKSNINCVLLFDDKGKEYLKLKSEAHCCIPLKFSNLKASGIKIQETSGIKVTEKKVDEKKIIKEENFELRPNRVGVPDAKLFIFSSADKTLCYEYSFQRITDKYICIKCSNVSVKLLTKEDGNGIHKCEPVIYKEKLQTVPASNFIIHSSNKKHIVSKLILFTNSDRILCYVYYHNRQCKNYYCRACFAASKKKVVTAKHLQNGENEAYLLLSEVKHLCTPQPYDPKELNEIPKIHSSRFEVLYNSTTRSRLFVFDENDIFKANVFRPAGTGLACRGCGEAKKFTGAKVCTNEAGEVYVELDESKHICKPENLFKSEMLIKREFFEESTDDNGNRIITTFHGENKTFSRIFVYDNQLQAFQCPKCVEKDRIVTAKICKRSDNKEYLLLYSTHICKPVPRVSSYGNSGLKKQRKETQLLTFDDNNKICYSGFCSVSINALSKYLTATPKTEDLKPVCASFDSDMVFEKNILFNVSGVQKFALVFASEVTCKKVKDAIKKYTNSGTPHRSVKENCLVSLFNEYNNADIARITETLLNAYNYQERNEIIKFLQEKGIHENICAKLISINSNTGEEANKLRGDNIQGALDSENHASSHILISEPRDDSSNSNISQYDESAEDGNDAMTCQGRKPRIMSKIKKKLKKPDYELLVGSIHGKKKTRLIIFESDKNFCYELYWNSNDKAYRCCGCAALRGRRVRAVIQGANTADEHVEVYHNHACQPREYADLKILKRKQTIQGRDFELQIITKDGNERKFLIIFAPSNRSLCYKYSSTKSQSFTCQKCAYKGLRVRAHLRVDENGNEYVVLGKESHICDLQPYVPVNITDDIIFESSLFEIFPQTKGKPKIFIFESLNNKKQGYLFSHIKEDRYICLGCEKIPGVNITVELRQKENGEYFVRMKSLMKHECKIREYHPQKWKETFVYPPNFFFYTKGTKHPQLVIFCSENKKLCYDYKFCGKNVMKCKACYRKKHYQSALVFQDSDGNEYLQLGINEHICQPAEYEDVEGTGLSILPSSGIKCQTQAKEKKIDENKIVKDDGFLLMSEDFILNTGTRLLIFDKNDKSLCFKYSYHMKPKRFYCLKCHGLNLNVSAKLCTNEKDNTKYLTLGENDHRCEPEKYEPKNISSKITDFLVFEPNNNKWKTSKLVVFASPNHSMCYVYSFCNTRKHYACHECLSSETRKCVSAKILKDENAVDYVLFNKYDHICKPIKYNLLDYETPKIPSSRFELLPNLWGTPNSRLFIFDVDSPNLCYEFSKKSGKTFECRGCLDYPDGKKYTKADLFQNESGETYVEVDETKHVCKIQDFKTLKRLFTAGEFEISKNSKREQILTTFHGKSNNLCYKFTYDNELQVFRCLKCKGKYVTAKVCKRNNGEEYVLLSYSHYCKAMTRIFHQNTY